MVNDLYDLIRRGSVNDCAVEGAPFGEGVSEVFHFMLSLAEREGFEYENTDEYAGHIDFGKSADRGMMGILCHLDVVSAGDGWDHDPFGGDVVDDVMYGRGTLDDKGPTIAAFYAMKALHDCGYEPEKKVRMIIGLDEETGNESLGYYMQRHEMPDFAIVPDSQFPIVHGEKGILVFELARKFGKAPAGGCTLRSIRGGDAHNIVPDLVTAVVSCADGYDEIKQAAEDYSARSHHRVTTRVRGKSLEITAEGRAAHGAMPWNGVNAISVMMDFLGNISFSNDDINDFIAFYNEKIGFRLYGEKIGCDLSDEESGRLTFNVGIIDVDREKGSVAVDVRYPVTKSGDDVYAGIMPALEEHEIGVVKRVDKEPLYFPADDPMIKELVDIYRRNTGDMDSQPIVCGGGTYARAMDNAVAYGALYPDDEDIMHGRNECVRIDSLVRTAKIYADAIFSLAVKPEAHKK